MVKPKARPRHKKPLTLDDARTGAAKLATGLATGLNMIGAICRGAGTAANVMNGTNSLTGRAIAAIGGDLVTAAQSIVSAAELIRGGPVIEVGEIVVEPTQPKDSTPPGRRPRQPR